MNSDWSASPFAMFTSDNLKHSETSRSKVHCFQELSRKNVFHMESHNFRMEKQQRSFSEAASEFSSVDVDARMSLLSNQNSLLEENEKTISRSVSCLLRKNVSTSKTIVKVCSKMTLSRNQPKDKRPSETDIYVENHSLPSTSLGISSSERNLVPEEDPNADIKWQASGCNKQTKNVKSSRKKKFQSQNTEDRNIGEPLLSCPFEVVEIYPFKKKRLTNFDGGLSYTSQENNSIRSFPEEDDEFTKSTDDEEHGCLLSGATLNKMPEKVWLTDGNAGCIQQNDEACEKNFCGMSSNISRDEDILVKPIRDRQDVTSVKNRTDIKKTNEACGGDALKETLKYVMSESKVVDDLNLNFISEESGKFSAKGNEEQPGETMDLEKSEILKRTPKCSPKEVRCSSAIEEDPEVSRLRKLYAKGDKSPSINYKKSVTDLTSLKMQTENKDRKIVQEKDQKLKYQSVSSTSSSESSGFDNNVVREDSTSSNESETSRLTKSKRSSITQLSETESSSRENMVINLKQMKSNPDTTNTSTESPQEKTMKVIIEKRENKKDSVNLERVAENKIDFYNKDARTLKIDDTKAEDPRVTQKKTTEIEIKDFENGIIQSDKERKKFNFEDMKLSTILTRIYQHLAYDWQRMKYIRIKLEGSISTDSNDFIMMIRLLGKTIARYKGYIHGLNDDSKVEGEIIKYSLNDLKQLTTAVNRSKIFLENQEQQLESVQLKPFLDWDSSDKYIQKRILGNVISFSNEWTKEVSNLIETLSNSVINVIVNNEEKENIKHPRRHKSTDRRASNNTSSVNYKQRSKTVRSQSAKVNLTKRDSYVETQMACTLSSVEPVNESESKTFMKAVHTSRNKEKEKLLDVDQNRGAEEKTYKGRTVKKSTLSSANQWKQKYRTSTNAQPVWRPGGAAKIPPSSSATILAKEKLNQPVKNTKETKQGRVASECKKKIASETYSIPDAMTPRLIDHAKLSSRNSSISLKNSPRLKSRTGAGRATLKGNNGHHHDVEGVTSKNFEKTARQRASKEPRILYACEEVNKPTIDMVAGKNRHQLQVGTDSVLLHLSSTTEKMRINEEEPTRDTDSSHLIKDRIKVGETIHENLYPIKKLPEQSYTLLSNTCLSKESLAHSITNCKDTVDKNVGSSRSKIHSSSVPVASTSCMADLRSNFDLEVEIEPLNCCQTSSNSIASSVSCQEQKNEVFGQSDNLQENCTDEQIGQKTRKSPINRERKLRASSRVTSLSILKEFLCEHGVDPDLVNKAEQRLKEKQKSQNGLKRKFMTFDDVSSSRKDSQNEHCQEDISEENTENCKGDSAECKNSRNVDKVANYPSLQPHLEKKDAATTCGVINSQDASSQTTPPWQLNKSSQSTEPETLLTLNQKVSATQTDTTLMKDVATEYYDQGSEDINNLANKSRDVSCMTELSLTSDYFKETVPVSYASKSVATEQIDCLQSNDSSKNVKEDSEQDSDNSAKQLIETCNRDKSDQELTRSCNHVFNILLKQMYECYDESLTNYKESDETFERNSLERDTSESFSCSDLSSMCSDNCVHNKLVLEEELPELPAREVSSEVVAAFQVAAIRARNVYRAIDLHKHNLQEKLKKLKKRREEIIKQNRSTPKQIVTNVYRSNSVTSITKKVGQSGENDIVEISKTLTRFEVARTFSKETASTSSTSISFSEDVEEIETIVSKKSSSKIVMNDARSSKDTLVHETERESFEQIQCIKKISNTCSKLRDEQTESETTQRHDKCSVFTRENLLPLVYGIVCSIVFWCLQFTITCDIVS